MSVRDFLEVWFATHPSKSVHVGEDGTRYWYGPAECHVCGHGWRAVAEVERGQREPVLPLECPKCGHAAGSPG